MNKQEIADLQATLPKKPNLNPCLKCERRDLKCHTICKEYLLMRQYYDAYNAIVFKIKQEQTRQNMDFMNALNRTSQAKGNSRVESLYVKRKRTNG